MTTLPALFISHGAPTFALQPGRIGPVLHKLGESLARPKAVVIVSPHWANWNTEVTAHLHPPTIHDFGGFPRVLYTLQYPAPGSPVMAKEVVDALQSGGVPARANPHQGLDHGAWVVLMHLYPQADVPVLQVSLNPDAGVAGALRLGQALAPLREQGYLVIGSGGMTHNLRDYRPGGAPHAYVEAFSGWMDEAIRTGNLTAMLDYRERAPFAERAHPMDEHLQPLFVAMGAGGLDPALTTRLPGGIEDSALCMDAYAFGAPVPDAVKTLIGATEATN
ncbi:class III extradiol ring-cleavage dioxygenase [Aquabacterium sp.]|uniref:DODA-type extradiol aromatic ring-opening family dioxygenase n=1 Tax=Aquabacterium sp. TaxID=1872578 RepID=UPI0035AD94E2